jgi:hypothetical protein
MALLGTLEGFMCSFINACCLQASNLSPPRACLSCYNRFVKGVGKAVIGAIVKPIVGIGDAAVLVMNHVSDATSNKQILPKIPKRLRRALPSHSVEKKNCVRLLPYDERAAKAQKIVTGGESVDDVYIGHVNIPSHLIIASEQCLWAIDRRTREPWCVSWEEISHFGISEGNMRVVVFSQTGLKTYIFQMDDTAESAELHKLLSMQQRKMVWRGCPLFCPCRVCFNPSSDSWLASLFLRGTRPRILQI